jgi:predicted aspartyl protease
MGPVGLSRSESGVACRGRRVLTSLLLAVVASSACRTATRGPWAAEIVEGIGDSTFVADTVTDSTSVGFALASRAVRARPTGGQSFWGDIAVLDAASAERSARKLDERTFALALGLLMQSEADLSAVAFRALRQSASDRLVRSRARAGLAMALAWNSQWGALAAATDPDSAGTDSTLVPSSVERWARVLASVPDPVFEIPDTPVSLPMRRSVFGTPVVTVRINGRPHEFWLDTGASMTLISTRIARAAGITLIAPDSLALNVVGGQIPARAILIDSLALGTMRAFGLGAALVTADELRLDQRVVAGVTERIAIDGVIGMDLMRHLDIVLDADAGTVTFSRPRRDPRAVRNLFWVGYPVVRLVASDGRPVLFGLDTGAEVSYATLELLRKLPRTPVAVRRRALGGLGSAKLATEWVARQVLLRSGDFNIALANLPVTPDLRWTFVTFDGVLGSDVALAARLHLDFVNGVFEVQWRDAAR